mmetsp:Transcript_39420/g.44350  ORF Transcript_39420/g.44350 Transcript_39420/m.44350 type:complete len:265 (-) Transcript_39420:190-984(-)
MKLNISVLQQTLVAVVLFGFSTSSPAVTVAVAVAVAATGEDSIGSVTGGVAAIANEDGDNHRRTKGAKTSPSGVLVSGTGGVDGTTNKSSEAKTVLEKKKTTTTSTRKFIQRSIIGIELIKCSSIETKKKCNETGDGACKFNNSKKKCQTKCEKITGQDPTQCENVKGCMLKGNGKCKKDKKKPKCGSLKKKKKCKKRNDCRFIDNKCKTKTSTKSPSESPSESPTTTFLPTTTFSPTTFLPTTTFGPTVTFLPSTTPYPTYLE